MLESLSPAIRADLHQLKAAIIGFARTLRASFRRLKVPVGSGLKVNLGCGPLGRSGWVNVDGYPIDGTVLGLDLRNALPFKDGVARHIHCEHFLEHLEFDQALRLLGECYRILQPGGSMRLILPDGGKYLRAYVERDEPFFARVKNIGNPSRALGTPMEIINQSFRMGGAHRFAWDEETLRCYLKESGFVDVVVSEPNQVDAELAIDGTDSWRRDESIYLNMRRS